MAVMVMLVTLFLAGAASAANDIAILPTIGDPGVLPDGTIELQVGKDAFTSIGLEAVYTGWPTTGSSSYNVYITDDSPGGVTVYSKSGTFTTSYTQEIHWTVPSDTSKTYTIWANGRFGKIHVYKDVPGAPVPELSTSILTATGLIGLLGLVRFRRRV